MNAGAELEIARGERFAFGDNWSKFLAVLDSDRVARATSSLRDLLAVKSLEGKTFLDVGSGSGLHSLAAHQLGAARIHSFDFDPQSVACTSELRRRHDSPPTWTIEQGSALDADYLARLGTFDVVYSWGVLHHTGDMWRAIDLVAPRVAPGGVLVIALYRDQGWRSRAWLELKRLYNRGALGRWLVGGTYCGLSALGDGLADAMQLRDPRRRYADYKQQRGMSKLTDWIDWIGGLPFEVASPAQVVTHLVRHGFGLDRSTTVTGHGCNEYVLSHRA